MIANLYVDHLMASPAVSSQDVWNATRTHGKLFSDAASRIGLTPEEYREFRTALLEGKATYVRLPRHIYAMSGSRRGSVYAVKNAYLTSTVKGWRVALADGKVVDVPQICGNLSLEKAPVIAALPRPKVEAVSTHRTPAFHRAVAVVPKETPVTLAPPEPVELPPAAPTVANATVATAGSHGGSGFLFLVPALLGGIFAGSHGGTNNPAPTCQPPIAALSAF